MLFKLSNVNQPVLKILILGPAYPLRGGIAAFNERLCQTFIKAGHQCSIISYSLQYPSILFPGKSQIIEGPAPDSIQIVPLINSINPFSWIRTARYILKEKPDLVIFRYWIPFMGPALGTIRFLTKKGQYTAVALVDNLIPHEKRPGDTVMTSYFMKNIEKYVVMSGEVKQSVLSMKPDASTLLLRHPIYDQYGSTKDQKSAREYLGLPPNAKIILFFGLIRKYKGLDLLIEAFAEMNYKEDVHLVIAGESYEEASTYLDLIRKNSLQDRVHWFDKFIPDEEVGYFFSAANLLALPYRTATQSGVTQIAFHFETPVLVTDVGGLSEIIIHEQNGLVCQPDIQSIARSLDYFFMENKEKTFREGMRSEKVKYDWRYFADNLLAFATNITR